MYNITQEQDPGTYTYQYQPAAADQLDTQQLQLHPAGHQLDAQQLQLHPAGLQLDTQQLQLHPAGHQLDTQQLQLHPGGQQTQEPIYQNQGQLLSASQLVTDSQEPIYQNLLNLNITSE